MSLRRRPLRWSTLLVRTSAPSPFRGASILTTTSLLHSLHPTPTPPSQIRLLLHALRKLQHFLLRLPLPHLRPLPLYTAPPARMEDLERHRHVRVARLSSPAHRRDTQLRAYEDSGMEEVIKRVIEVEDDGHVCKLVRALANGKAVCRGYEGEVFRIKGDMWRKLGHMAVDSVEAGEPQWVRSCGFEEAWEKIPLREGAKL